MTGPEIAQVVKVVATELDPNKQYMISFDKRAITQDDIQRLANKMANIGFKGVFLALDGDPVASVNVISQEREFYGR